MKAAIYSPGLVLGAICALAVWAQPVRASIAYGSINNFDTVNDTGHECHGFEIELDDCHSTDITYTYNYNHYGVPKITEDNADPAHPKVFIRWESAKNPDGSWAALTIIPTGPIAPTNGHQFTNPAVNFGGEHFGAGYRVQPSAVFYNWLIDSGGALVRGGAVQVSTPTFTYYPAVAGAVAPPQVQAVIAPPPPPVREPKEFGKPVWVKEIRTTTHNNHEVRLRDLVSDDPDDPDDKNWRNGEPDEVEAEWQVLQKDYNKVDAPNNKLVAAAEDLPGGDEVVTRRYEFFKYIGPLDTETGEAMAQSVAADGIHGVGTKLINGVTVDLASVAIVGDFTGSQMAAVDVDAPVALIDHVGDGAIDVAFAARAVVIEGTLPFTATLQGPLPAGMGFDVGTGILSGTPIESGEFIFNITASDGVNPDVSKNYTLRIAAVGEALAPVSLVDTAASPVGTGATTGDGAFATGSNVTLEAMAQPGFRFVNWTDNGKPVSTDPSYTLVLDVNRSLVANFAVIVPQCTIATNAVPGAAGTTSGGGLLDEGSSVTVLATPSLGYAFTNWTESGLPVSTTPSYTFTVATDRTLVANFAAVPTYSVTTSGAPTAGGTAAGDGTYSSGTNATVTASANAGYVFARWTDGGTLVSSLPSYTFKVLSNKTLVANFILAGSQQTISTSANPTVGGTTTGGGTYASGDSATVVALPNPYYKFSKWQDGGTDVSTSESYTFTVAGTRTLTARFIEAFVITAGTSPGIGGTTEMDSVTYKTGEKARAKAFPAGGFSFANWTEDGVIVSTSAIYDFDVTGNRTIIANFLADAGVTVTTNAAPAAGGSVSGDGAYAANDDVWVSAVANDGFGFVNWTERGVPVSSDPDYPFTADGNRALVAHFAPLLAIVASAEAADGGVLSGAGDYVGGTDVTLNAAANPGYAFHGWTENGVTVSTAETYLFTATGPRTLVANFIALPPLAAAIAAPDAASMKLSWPTPSVGWVLEESADLKNWTPSARVIATIGGQKTVTIPTTDACRFFHLAHP